MQKQQEKDNAMATVHTLMQHLASDAQELNNLIQSIQQSEYLNSTHARMIQHYQIKLAYSN